MKRIVNGLLYDTAKAEVVSKREYGVFSETLYRTKKGRFFLFRYYPESELRTGIRVMTRAEAFQWLAEHDPDKALETFPEEKIEEA